VVIPFYNEEENLRVIYSELSKVRVSALSHYRVEIVFMDNHSTDNSFEVAREIAASDANCRVIRLSRNFGYQANILTGFLNCSGDAAIQLDADGEDDPQLIPEFVAKWEKGFDVVYGIRRKRHEGVIISFQRKLFYRLLNSISSVNIPLDAGDFRLIDRKVIDALAHFREANLYLRGLIAYVGFNQVGIEYDRRKRYRGESKFSWWDYVSLAWQGITSFSAKPLQVATWLGFALAFVSFLGGFIYLAMYLRGDIIVPGFTTMVLVQLFLAGVQLLVIGLVGKYIGAIFDEVKRRPRSIVERQAGGDLQAFQKGYLD
jgi:polyisoprenyl-phosphate glycosyltransferase